MFKICTQNHPVWNSLCCARVNCPGIHLTRLGEVYLTWQDDRPGVISTRKTGQVLAGPWAHMEFQGYTLDRPILGFSKLNTRAGYELQGEIRQIAPGERLTLLRRQGNHPTALMVSETGLYAYVEVADLRSVHSLTRKGVSPVKAALRESLWHRETQALTAY